MFLLFLCRHWKRQLSIITGRIFPTFCSWFLLIISNICIADVNRNVMQAMPLCKKRLQIYFSWALAAGLTVTWLGAEFENYFVFGLVGLRQMTKYWHFELLEILLATKNLYLDETALGWYIGETTRGDQPLTYKNCLGRNAFFVKMWYLFLILAISSTLGIPVNEDESGKRGKSRLLTHFPFIFIFQETFKAFIVSRLCVSD